jgi:predicted ATPase
MIADFNVSITHKMDKQITEMMANALYGSLSISDSDIQKTIIDRYFRSEFERQINHVNRPDLPGEVLLSIRDKTVSVTIKNNKCYAFSDEIGIYCDAMYIDTPFVMDSIRNNSQSKRNRPYSLTGHKGNLLHRLEYTSDNTVLEEVRINRKINHLLENIRSVIDGEFHEENEKLMFTPSEMKKAMELSNMSTGIKAFLIIKRLLELGEIKERGVLIFDEPEIHLHPEWQIRFAEILVLLQKEFNLTILLTTHSPYFLSAIETFAKKQGIANMCTYYLATSSEDIATIQDVSENTDMIYRQLAGPFQKLENILHEDD